VTVLLGAGVARHLGVTNLGLDVWLDHRGRVVRLAYDVDVGRLPLQAAEAAVAGKVRTTLSFDRFGVGVTVDPPPPGQVTSG
jgi:hypothetical protein